MSSSIIQPNKYIEGLKGPLFVAGPCSAETEEQVMATARAISQIKSVKVYRAGVWKPRTRPNAFEGNGEQALKWLQQVKPATGLLTAVEVANAEHLELCLKYNVDIVWIGARTTVNPFSVQEIADGLKGVDIPVFIKNPINPDLKLWIGAIERISKAGIHKIAAIHRGFQAYENSVYRYSPMWDIPIELMAAIPDLPVICDPSHITGKRSMVAETAQKAMNLGMHGLMIESHLSPDDAWSDAAQQITPQTLAELLKNIKIRTQSTDDLAVNDELKHLRTIIDSIDEELLGVIAKRMKAIEKIGNYKRQHNVAIFQPDRLAEILKTRKQFGDNLQLDSDFIEKLLLELHSESIRYQTEIVYKPTLE